MKNDLFHIAIPIIPTIPTIPTIPIIITMNALVNIIDQLKSNINEMLIQCNDISLMREALVMLHDPSASPTAFMDIAQRLDRNITEQEEQKEQKNNSIEERLAELIPLFRDKEIFEDIRSLECILTTGRVQSGKSAAICGIAIYNIMVIQRPVVIVLRNSTADYKQLLRNFYTRFREFNVPVQYSGDCSTSRIFSQVRPTITICIEHQKHLEMIAHTCDDYAHLNFCLMADEADAVCYKENSDALRIGLFNRIRRRASQFIGVTATAFDLFFMENQLLTNAIIRVPVPDNYKGINHPLFTINELPISFKFTHDIVNNTSFRLSSDMNDFYINMVSTEPYALDQGIHPVICLEKTGSTIMKQLQKLKALATTPLIMDTLTIAVYNGKGATMWSPTGIPLEMDISVRDEKEMLVGKPFSNSFIEPNMGCVYFKDAGIGDVLQGLRNARREDSTLYNHITILSDNMVKRKLNICTNDYKEHITHQILRVSPTASCSDMTQSIRSCGCFNDNIPLNIYCLQKDAICLKQTHDLHERLLEGAELSDAIQEMGEMCTQLKVAAGSIPIRKLSGKYPRPNFNVVYANNSGTQRLCRRDECIQQFESDSGIGQIVRYFLTHPPMRLENFKEQCRELFGIRYHSFMVDKIGKYTCYGPLLTNEHGYVRLHQDYHTYSSL
jgi:flagellar biosynthesis regulator FlbT